MLASVSDVLALASEAAGAAGWPGATGGTVWLVAVVASKVATVQASGKRSIVMFPRLDVRNRERHPRYPHQVAHSV